MAWGNNGPPKWGSIGLKKTPDSGGRGNSGGSKTPWGKGGLSSSRWGSSWGSENTLNKFMAACIGGKKRAQMYITGTMEVCECGRSFKSKKSQEQHKKDQYNRKRALEYICPVPCCRQSFAQQFSLCGHQSSKNHWRCIKEKEYVLNVQVCPCGKKCRSMYGLLQHQESEKHFRKMRRLSNDVPSPSFSSRQPNLKRQKHLMEMYENQIRVKFEDREKSLATMNKTLSTIMEHALSQPGGDIYQTDLRTAGSHATKTQIGKADEFDWIIPLHVKSENIVLEMKGPTLYELNNEEGNANLDIDKRVVDDNTSTIPDGYVLVTRQSTKKKGCMPSNLLHEDCVISYKVKKDLHDKIKTVLESSGLRDQGVTISPKAHGPALTITLMPLLTGSHDINVDLVPSLPSNIPVTSCVWPRNASMEAFTKTRIEAAKKAGTHLVPKKDIVFALSYSKAENALLRGIDSGNECRRMCHQVIKKYLKTFKSQRSAEAMSSHIFKNQLLNMIEAHPEPGYWKMENFGERVVDMLRDCESKLRDGKLPDYFKPEENVLEGKDRILMNDLADFFCSKRRELENM